ncbi:MAG: hypothetical protein ABIW80_05680 [Lapillicoccus sp.]
MAAQPSLPAVKPPADEVAAALRNVDPARLVSRTVSGWLAHTALELGLPLQVHTGYGDPDLGLATHNTGALSVSVLRETLELVPFGALLFSTDAYGLAELFYLGASLFRRAFDGVVDPLVAAGEMAESDADRLAAMVARDTASRVYGL